MFHWERQARKREQQLAELEQEVVEKSSSLDSLHRQLEETRRRQEEHRLAEGELSRTVATPTRAKVRKRHPGDGGCLAGCCNGRAVSCRVWAEQRRGRSLRTPAEPWLSCRRRTRTWWSSCRRRSSCRRSCRLSCTSPRGAALS